MKHRNPRTRPVALALCLALLLTLLPAPKAHAAANNDDWKNATLLYDGVPQSYDLIARNDAAWFKIQVPEETGSLVVKRQDSGEIRLYREADLLSAGTGAKEIAFQGYQSEGILTVDTPAAGTYYVQCQIGYDTPETDIRLLHQTICYAVYGTLAPTNTTTAAATLPCGQWYEGFSGGYLGLGQLKEGDEVRVSTDGRTGLIELVEGDDDDGISVVTFDGNAYRDRTLLIPEDGTYYLYVDFSCRLDNRGEFETYRLRYDVGDQTYPSVSIEGQRELTVKVGDRIYPDLRIAPYDADLGTRGSGSFFIFENVNDSVAYGDNDDGYIYARRVGNATIRVRVPVTFAVSATTKTITVHVVDEDTTTPTTQMSIQNAPEALALGEKAALTVARNEGANDMVSWYSENTSVLHVSSKGVVTAVGQGSAVITATSSSGVQDRVEITATVVEEVVTVTGEAPKLWVAGGALNKDGTATVSVALQGRGLICDGDFTLEYAGGITVVQTASGVKTQAENGKLRIFWASATPAPETLTLVTLTLSGGAEGDAVGFGDVKLYNADSARVSSVDIRPGTLTAQERVSVQMVDKTEEVTASGTQVTVSVDLADVGLYTDQPLKTVTPILALYADGRLTGLSMEDGAALSCGVAELSLTAISTATVTEYKVFLLDAAQSATPLCAPLRS